MLEDVRCVFRAIAETVGRGTGGQAGWEFTPRRESHDLKSSRCLRRDSQNTSGVVNPAGGPMCQQPEGPGGRAPRWLNVSCGRRG